MTQIVLPTDLTVTGRIAAGSMSIPANTLVNADVASDAAIDASKLGQHYAFVYAEAAATEVTDKTLILYKAHGTGTLKFCHARYQTAPTGSANVTVDIQKNAVSVLNAVVTLNLATSSGDATILTTAFVAGDVLTLVLNATATGTDVGPKGIYVDVHLDEAYPTS